MSIRLCIVGCGIVSPLHIRSAIRSKYFVHTALVDLSEERRKEALEEIHKHNAGCEVKEFSDFDAALECDKQTAGGLFDAIELLLPHHLHRQFAERAFKTGKHVLLEKPMATDVESCKEILAAAEARVDKDKTVFMVGENSAYWPEVVQAAELVKEGAIGELLTVRANNSESLLGSMFMPSENDWHVDGKKAGGGVTIDGGLHWLRPMKVWLGDIESVIAFTATHPGAERYCAGETICRSLVRFQGGKCGTFDATYCAAALAPQPWFVLTGEKGEIAIEPSFDGGLTLYNADNPKGKKIQLECGGYWESFTGEMKDWGSAIQNGTPLKYAPEEAMKDIMASLAMYRSRDSLKFEKLE